MTCVVVKRRIGLGATSTKGVEDIGATTAKGVEDKAQIKMIAVINYLLVCNFYYSSITGLHAKRVNNHK